MQPNVSDPLDVKISHAPPDYRPTPPFSFGVIIHRNLKFLDEDLKKRYKSTYHVCWNICPDSSSHNGLSQGYVQLYTQTGMEKSSFGRNGCHWLHRTLSFWNHSVHAATEENFPNIRFSVFRSRHWLSRGCFNNIDVYFKPCFQQSVQSRTHKNSVKLPWNDSGPQLTKRQLIGLTTA